MESYDIIALGCRVWDCRLWLCSGTAWLATAPAQLRHGLAWLATAPLVWFRWPWRRPPPPTSPGPAGLPHPAPAVSHVV